MTEMMNRVHIGVNSRFSPKAILIFRKIAPGWGGILESPPWGRNEPTGHSGPLGRPHQVRGRMPCDQGTVARTGSGSRGHRNTVTTRFKSRRPEDVPYTRWQLRVVGLGRRDGPLGTATLYHLRSIITQWYSSLPMAERLSAPAPVAKINRLQVVSAAPHAYQPDDAHVRLPLTLLGIRSGTVFPRFFSPETLRSCRARTAGKPSKTIPALGTR